MDWSGGQGNAEETLYFVQRGFPPDLGARWRSWQEGPTLSPAQAQAGVSVMESGLGVKDKQLNKPITNRCYSFHSLSIKALLDNLRGCLSMEE